MVIQKNNALDVNNVNIGYYELKAKEYYLKMCLNYISSQKPGSRPWNRRRSRSRRRRKHSVNMREVREARVKYKENNEKRTLLSLT